MIELSLIQWLILGLVAALGATTACVLLFAIEDLFGEDNSDQPCIIHADQWGLRCSVHKVRIKAFDQCPKGVER